MRRSVGLINKTIKLYNKAIAEVGSGKYLTSDSQTERGNVGGSNRQGDDVKYSRRVVAKEGVSRSIDDAEKDKEKDLQ